MPANAQQNARIAKREKELRISKALLDLQGKAHEILELALPRVDDDSAMEVSSSLSNNSATKTSL